MIRPWYRSRLFWLGLPGLVFLLWLWLAKAGQSFDFGHIAITGPSETTSRWIGAADGAILQTTIKFYSVGGGSPGFYWREFQGAGAGVDSKPVSYFPLRPFEIIREELDDVESREIRLAWWVIISAYMAVWLGAVAGWQRRKATLSRRAAVELPGS